MCGWKKKKSNFLALTTLEIISYTKDIMIHTLLFCMYMYMYKCMHACSKTEQYFNLVYGKV